MNGDNMPTPEQLAEELRQKSLELVGALCASPGSARPSVATATPNSDPPPVRRRYRLRA